MKTGEKWGGGKRIELILLTHGKKVKFDLSPTHATGKALLLPPALCSE